MQIPEFHPEARKIFINQLAKKANNAGAPQYNVGNTQKSPYLADKEMPNTQCTVNDTTMLFIINFLQLIDSYRMLFLLLL